MALRVLRGTAEQVAIKSIQLHNVELYNMCPSPNIIMIIN
jgi:hypothetical protein